MLPRTANAQSSEYYTFAVFLLVSIDILKSELSVLCRSLSITFSKHVHLLLRVEVLAFIRDCGTLL